MTTTRKIADQTKKNIDFLTSKKGWEEVKNILSMAAFNMNKKERKEFFDIMKNEDEKRNFLIYLFSTTAIEASLIQTGVIRK
jgi:phosphatidate phosphatase PAH1